MMDDYISRDAALTALQDSDLFNTTERQLRAIRELPAADVAEVVHRRWISFLDGAHIMPERYYRCSRCGRAESRRQPYCHCGAKMDGAAE